MFGVGVSGSRGSRRSRMAAFVLLCPLLAACSSSLSSSSFSSLFGSKAATTTNASATAGETPPLDFECPDVQIRSGAATLTSSANPAEPTALNMRYQVTIGTTARECRMGPNNMVQVKVGMQGRVILGPEGGNQSTINVPLRFAVVRETVDTKVITTQLDRVTVTIPPNDSNVLFSHVSEGMEFALPKGGDIDYYLIYIGFDPAAE